MTARSNGACGPGAHPGNAAVVHVIGGSGGEGAPVGGRRGSEVAAEVEPEVVGAAEAAAPRYLLDGERAVLEQLAGDVQALGGQPAQRRGAGFGEEPAGEEPLGRRCGWRAGARRAGRAKADLGPGPGGRPRRFRPPPGAASWTAGRGA